MNETIRIGQYNIPVYRFDVLIAGTGAAGLNAADTLYDEGVRNLAIITEGLKAGTSRNTGSDKQTYYKLSLAGDAPDSVRTLAQTIFEGGSVDGDIALCEAAASVPCFMKLVRLGVPFPKNPWGEYVGYKTDHDPARRATSAGPYTSRYMTEALEAQVLSKGIKVFGHFQIVKLLTEKLPSGRVCVSGIMCLNLDTLDFAVFQSSRIILATGGPAGIYSNTVYPESQNGATGAAFEAGALGKNLTEWQYGLASIKPRWNVSGTFMQVLPRFISTDKDKKDEKEFLAGYFGNPGQMLSLVFLKGYQWPFDTQKIISSGGGNGSSIIDILVYLETARGRRVFLDYRQNPGAVKNLDFMSLSDEARNYLETAGACFGTPYERLVKMNSPAAEFYRTRGTDLSLQPLEIALCAQHNNGGLAVDSRWSSNIEGLFPVGEAAGTHGVYRPGGSALNAGQAGSSRAASFIARELLRSKPQTAGNTEDTAALNEQILEVLNRAASFTGNGMENAADLLAEIRRKMSLFGGAFRNPQKIGEALDEIRDIKIHFNERAGIKDKAGLSIAFRLWDTLVCQELYLSAMLDFTAKSGRSRGSALYHNKSGMLPLPGLPEELAFLPDDCRLNASVQEIKLEDGKPVVSWRAVHPVPAADESFELVWKNYREENSI
ncbi:MAG: FAD-binding protein [Treponema sp.]|nr:FAD-binding protein [Treponema sp.]